MAVRDLKGCLKAILKPGLRSEPTKEGEIVLRECDNRGGIVMEVEIIGVSSTVTAVHLSGARHLSALNEGKGRGWNQVCDYLLIDDRGDRCSLTLIELKKTFRENRRKPFEQLRRSLPLADYLLSVCGVECHRCWPYTVNYVLIAEKQADRFDKQPTRPRPGPQGREHHEGIDVSVFTGTAVNAAQLVSC